MQNLPHHYIVTSSSVKEGQVDLLCQGLEKIVSGPPAEFGGPGDRWSPETLLVAAIADCFLLTFKAIARASDFNWLSLNCDVTGVLDRIDKVTKFSEFTLRVDLAIPNGTDELKAKRLLEKSEQACLISNSLNAKIYLEAGVRISV
jgi:organic hydroperoxide reductase OsmC/OhrA